jgi:hypothetical protein
MIQTGTACRARPIVALHVVIAAERVCRYLCQLCSGFVQSLREYCPVPQAMACYFCTTVKSRFGTEFLPIYIPKSRGQSNVSVTGQNRSSALPRQSSFTRKPHYQMLVSLVSEIHFRLAVPQLLVLLRDCNSLERLRQPGFDFG